MVSVTDGIVPRPRPVGRDAGRDARVPAGNTFGLALNLERDSVGAVILGEYEHISEGDTVKCTGRILEVPVGPELIGRVVNALGQPIDGKGPINAKMTDVIEKVAPGVIARKSVQPAGADRPEVDRRDGADRPRPARADHRRPPDRQDRGGGRHDHQPEGQGPDLHLRRDRPEGLVDQERGAQARGARRDGLHHRRRRLGVRVGGDAVHRAVLGLHDGRVLPRPRPGRADHLRRPDQAGRGPTARCRCCCAARRAARPIPGDVFYLHSPPARARRARQRGLRREVHQGRGQGQDRLADRAADHRDAGRRRVRVRADQRDLDHRRPDLPRDRPVQRRHPPGHQRRHLGVARRRRGADQGDQEARRRRAHRRSRSTASWRRSRSSPPTSTRPPASSSTAARCVTELLKQPQYSPLPVSRDGASRCSRSTRATSTTSTVKKALAFEHGAAPAPEEQATRRCWTSIESDQGPGQGRRGGARRARSRTFKKTGAY
ncbi:MAG: hypothetical protein MZW92_50565 [Comamonadaceae bacterium]|nr:hypothetical protein [Comamonadaceae bacterium]